jgi:protein O-GlcNAc transferase
MAPDAEAAFALALAQHEAGQLAAAASAYRAILRHDPDHAESLHLLGLITAQSGAPEAGARMIQRAISLSPGRAPHFNSLAMAWRLLGDNARAVEAYEAASALRPKAAEIHNNMATTLRDMGRYAEAVARYRLALTLAPEAAEIWYNLASTLADSTVDPGAAAETETCFRRAIELRSDHAAALANYGRWLVGQARWLEAEAWLSEAVWLTPNDARCWNNLAVARHQLGHTAAAVASYRRAIDADANFADPHYNLGCLLATDGQTDQALVCHAAALAAEPLHGAARLASCTAWLPMVYRSEGEIEERRAGYLAALDQLAVAVETPEVARAVGAAIGTSQPFFLPYQGQNDRAAQTKFGSLACRLLDEPRERTKLARRPAPNERIRIAIVSGYYLDHTIFKLFLEGWLTGFDRERFELIACHTGHARDERTAWARTMCDRFIDAPNSPAAWRDAIEAVAPHVVLYPEIGMDPTCAALAARRLAPVQCVAWGHPETTGMPTLDYFLSSELMEPPDGDEHYSERLVRLPGLGVHYTPDDDVPPPLDRDSLGLPRDVPVYWSGQALYKYLPRFDMIYPRIAAAVAECRFIFIDFAKSESVTKIFRERLAREFAAHGLDAARYCVFLPPMAQRQFIAAVGAADVILDTVGWSGGRSTFDCLARESPIVTLPGQFMRGRHTAAILRQIGCEATVAGSLDEYIALAVRLGIDAAWREEIRGLVARGKSRAFRDTAPIRALETFLASRVNAATERMPVEPG